MMLFFFFFSLARGAFFGTSRYHITVGQWPDNYCRDIFCDREFGGVIVKYSFETILLPTTIQLDTRMLTCSQFNIILVLYSSPNTETEFRQQYIFVSDKKIIKRECLVEVAGSFPCAHNFDQTLTFFT
jgi:hypothetical protein